MHSYDYGDQVVSTATFTTAATGAAVDPTNVYFSFKTPVPNSVITTYHFGVDPEITNTAVGVYSVTLNITEVGDWHYRWYSTGTGRAAAEGAFNVKSSEFD